MDPFVSGRIGKITEVPPVYTCDLVSYLVGQTSFASSSQFKAHKGLEAYNCEWIKDICDRKVGGKYLVNGWESSYYCT